MLKPEEGFSSVPLFLSYRRSDCDRLECVCLGYGVCFMMSAYSVLSRWRFSQEGSLLVPGVPIVKRLARKTSSSNTQAYMHLSIRRMSVACPHRRPVRRLLLKPGTWDENKRKEQKREEKRKEKRKKEAPCWNSRNPILTVGSPRKRRRQPPLVKHASYYRSACGRGSGERERKDEKRKGEKKGGR